jgi:hypothetical protein
MLLSKVIKVITPKRDTFFDWLTQRGGAIFVIDRVISKNKGNTMQLV